MRKLILALALLLAMMSTGIYAGTTGKLAGRIKDSSGNPIGWANVMFKGTQIGTQTKENGSFMIINIPPGKYTLVVMMMGYGTYEEEGVKINVDETSTKNITLQKQSVQMKGIVVKEKEQLVTKDKAGSTKSLSSDQISNIAVDDLEGVIAIQAGVSKSNGELHVRGGRANEIVFTVDGVSVSDPVDGGGALSVDMDAVADMKVMTGGFTAEYGNAQSGMVNIVTKDGGETYQGKIESRTDHLFTEGSNSDEMKFSFSGPVLGGLAPTMKKRFTFFLNGSALWDDTRYKDYYKKNPSELKYLITDYPTYDPYEDRSSVGLFDIGNRNNNQYTANLKFKYVIDSKRNLAFSVRGDRSLFYPYAHSMRYALQHYAYSETNQKQYNLTYDNTFDNNIMNLKVKANVYAKDTIIGPKGIGRDSYIFKTTNSELDTDNYNPSVNLYGMGTIDSNNDGIYDYGFNGTSDWVYEIAGLTDPRPVLNFAAPGTIFTTYQDDQTRVYTLRTDFEYQYNEIHGFKTGIEVIKNHIKKNTLASFTSIDANRWDNYLREYGVVYKTVVVIDSSIASHPVTSVVPYYTIDSYYNAAKAASGYRDGYIADPYQASYYLQDKMEWEGMIVNLGLRFDFWYLGNSYKVQQDDNTFETTYFYNKDKFQMMVSPRLSISHPISLEDVIHFAYNYQNQLPQMQYIFTSKNKADAFTQPNITIGKPSLEPQITMTYEVGLQHQLSEDYVMDVTAYYKNIYNYMSTKQAQLESEAAIQWFEFDSKNYGSARGIDLSLERRMANFVSASMSYSLCWALGNSSNDTSTDTNLREFPLDWDIRNNANFNVNFRVEKDEEFMVPYTSFILPFDDFGISLTYNVATGKPYTPSIRTGAVTTPSTNVNSERMKWEQNTNLSINKRLSVTKMTYLKFTFSVDNLFKNMIYNSVYPLTGNPYYDGIDQTDASGFLYDETQYLHDVFTKNPSKYNNDRSINFGVSYNW